jgi:hypothetical protein
MRAHQTALLCTLLAGGCAGTELPPVIDPRDVHVARGAPQVTRIRDAGTVMVPKEGAIDALTDGVASPGELLVVEGSGFGRQPTVTVGGRPAEVLARTRGDGLVVRVPGGSASGIVDVAVTTSAGSARLGVELRRLGIALGRDDKLRFFVVGRDELKPLPNAVAINQGREIGIDSTGGAALVLADASEGSRLVVVDLGRTDPSILGSLAVPHRGAALAAASIAPRVAIVGDGKLSVIDTSSLRRPVLYDPAPLPKEARGIRAAQLSPDGRVLALLCAEGNRVVALDVSSPTAPQLISSVEILPNERLSLVRDIAFSADGQTLWVISGASADTHPQVVPTRITAVRLLAAYAEGGPTAEAGAEVREQAPSRPIPAGPIRRMLAVWKTQTVTGCGAPLALAVGTAPDAGGSAIRNTPETATIFVTAIKDALLELKSGTIDLARVKKLLGPPNAGMIARAELGAGGGPVATTKQLLGALVVPPGNREAIALAVQAEESALVLGIAQVSLDGQARVKFAPLAPIDPANIHPPFRLGDLALQP